uniref:Uncharacterized protein n=1 Tax=Glossina palpalis gambiensis TaxID=67801 RepID=A0A1B0AUQ2_9MUSC
MPVALNMSEAIENGGENIFEGKQQDEQIMPSIYILTIKSRGFVTKHYSKEAEELTSWYTTHCRPVDIYRFELIIIYY